MSVNKKRVLKVLDRIRDLVNEDDDYADMFCEDFEPMLETIHCNDGFGTEGQCDPRGDFRDGAWGMDNVQDVDD